MPWAASPSHTAWRRGDGQAEPYSAHDRSASGLALASALVSSAFVFNYCKRLSYDAGWLALVEMPMMTGFAYRTPDDWRIE